MSYRQTHDRNHTLKAPDLRVDDDEEEGAEPPAPRKRRSRFGTLLRLLVVLVVLIAVAAAVLFGAARFGLVDPAKLGLPPALLNALGLGGSGGGTAQRPPAATPDIVFAGDAGALSAAAGNTVAPDPSATVAWLRSAVKSASAAGATGGISVAVPAELLPRLEGRRVRVTISAKSGAEGDPVPFAAAYTAGTRDSSGWIVFVPEKEFTDHSFSFVVPIGALEGGEPHRIAIWADIEGRNMPLAVRSITIQPD